MCLSPFICVLCNVTTSCIFTSPQPRSWGTFLFRCAWGLCVCLSKDTTDGNHGLCPLPWLWMLENHGWHTLNCAILWAPMTLTAISIPKMPNLLLIWGYLSSISNLYHMGRYMCASEVNLSVICILFFTPLTHSMPCSHWMYFYYHCDLGSPPFLSSLDSLIPSSSNGNFSHLTSQLP